MIVFVGQSNSAKADYFSDLDLKLPFSGGDNWWITCDYQDGNCSSAHGAGKLDEYALDFNSGNDQDKPIVAAAGGNVKTVVESSTGYGNYVEIDHGNGYVSKYAHLESISVKLDDTIVQGQQIGTCGSTGNSTGPHLHFVMYYTDDDGAKTSIKPEPMSGYTNFEGGESESYTSNNFWNPYTNFEVGKFIDGWRFQDVSSAEFIPYSRPFAVAYFNNGESDSLGYPIENVTPFPPIENPYFPGTDFSDTSRVWIQDFEKDGKQFTLVLNPHVYNLRYGYLGVVYPIHGQIRNYWQANLIYENYWQLGAPVTNEYLWSDSIYTYTVQWFERTENNFVCVAYNNQTGQISHGTSEEIGIPLDDFYFNQAIERNCGCPDGDCGSGGAETLGMNFPRYGFAAIAYKNKIYAIGGWNPFETKDPSVEIFDIAKKEWTPGPTVNQPTGIVACVEYNGFIYCFQGTDVKRLNVAHASDSWETVTDQGIDVGSGPDRIEAAVMGNQVYIASTYDSNLYYYNISTGVGGVETTLPVSRSTGFGMCTQQESIYIIGGSVDTSHAIMGYNPKSRQWRNLRALNTYYNSKTESFNGIFYIVGGGGYMTRYTGDEIYQVSPNNGGSTLFYNLDFKRGEMSTAIIDDKLYVIGGRLEDGSVSGSMEIISLPQKNTLRRAMPWIPLLLLGENQDNRYDTKFPIANITVDGNINDWDTVDFIVNDDVGERFPAGADIEYTKFAFSPNRDYFYILLKVNGTISSDYVYRFWLDKNQNCTVDSEMGDFQIDLASYSIGNWSTTSQEFLPAGGWRNIEDNGIVAANGSYIEARVDASAFNLPDSTMYITGRSQQMQPFTSLDWWYESRACD